MVDARNTMIADLDLVGLGFRADRKVIDKVVDGLKFHR
jgi:hypothetical protein